MRARRRSARRARAACPAPRRAPPRAPASAPGARLPACRFGQAAAAPGRCCPTHAALTLAGSHEPSGSRRDPARLLGPPHRRLAHPELAGELPIAGHARSIQAPGSQVVSRLIPIVFSACYFRGRRAFIGSSKLPMRSTKMSPRLQSQIAKSKEEALAAFVCQRRPRSTRCLLGSRRSATITSTTAPDEITWEPRRHPRATTPSC